MTTPLIQTSFAAGELSPQLYSRVDLSKYAVGTALMRNFFVDVRGGASTRPGLQFAGRCLLGINRLIPFQFNTLQAYVLVFSDKAMRVVKDGALVTEPGFAVSAISQSDPMTYSAPSNNFVAGDWVYTVGATGMTEVNQQTYKVIAVSGGLFSLADLDGNPINSTDFPAYTGGATVARIFTLTTPYLASDLQSLKFAQSADVMTLTHPDYTPMDLTRTQHYVWTLSTITFAAAVQPPIAVGVLGLPDMSTTPSLDYTYAITSLDDETGEESQMIVSPTIENKALNQDTGCNNQIEYTAPTTGPVPDRYNIYKAQPIAVGAAAPSVFGYIGQTTELTFVDSNIAPDFTQTPPLHRDPFADGNNPSVVTYFQQRKVFAATDLQSETYWMTQTGNYRNMDVSIPVRDSDAITGTLASLQVNAIEFLVPMQSGLIMLSSGGAWQVSGGTPGSAITPSDQQAQPQAFNGCHFHVPPIPINYDILYVQTKGAVVRDLAYNFYLNVYTGTDLTVLSNHLFFGHQIEEWAYAEYPWKLVWAVRDDGVVLSLAYLKEQDVYGWSHHDTAGRFKSVTGIPENPNTGVFSAEDVIYFTVERVIPGVNNGAAVQYIERLASRNFTSGGAADITKPWCVDCGLSYTGLAPGATLTAAARAGTANIASTTVTAGGLLYEAPVASINDPTGTGAQVTAETLNGSVVSVTVTAGGKNYTKPQVRIVDPTGNGYGAVAWATITNDVLFSADADAFTSAMVGWTIRMGGGMATITSFIDTQNVMANVTLPIIGDLQAQPSDWNVSEPITTVTGLEHLEGATVAILADGSVMPQQVVTNGQVVLPNPAAFIIIGLPYTCQMQTLRLDTGNPTIQDKRKLLSRFTVRVVETRGLQIGRTFLTLTPYKERNQSQPYGTPIPFITSDEGMPIDPLWDAAGQVCIQQSNPLPSTVTGCLPWAAPGDTPG